MSSVKPTPAGVDQLTAGTKVLVTSWAQSPDEWLVATIIETHENYVVLSSGRRCYFSDYITGFDNARIGALAGHIYVYDTDAQAWHERVAGHRRGIEGWEQATGRAIPAMFAEDFSVY